MDRQAPQTPEGRRRRGTRHRGSGINKRNAAAEERLAAMRSANTALAASLFLSNAPTQEVGGPTEPSNNQVVAATDSTPSSPRGRSPPNSSSFQLRTASTNNAAAAAIAIEPQDTEVDTFLASLSIHTTTTTENTPAAQTPNEDNVGNAAAETRAGEDSAGVGGGKPTRKRAFDFFDDSSSNENEKHVDREGAKHA